MSYISEICVCDCDNVSLTTYCSFCRFAKYLEFYAIEINRWGTNDAKTIQHLIKEINEGESTLCENDDGLLVRQLNIVTAKIYFETNEGTKYILSEDRQVFNDGRRRIRQNDSSVSEKMKPNENPEDAIKRGIQEELSIQGELIITNYEKKTSTNYTDSYPTLLSQYIIHRFNVYLNEAQFNINGYFEEQPDKTTYFIWLKVE